MAARPQSGGQQQQKTDMRIPPEEEEEDNHRYEKLRGQEADPEEVEVLEEVELSDDEEQDALYKYEEVPEVGGDEEDDLDADEDLAAALAAVVVKKGRSPPIRSPHRRKSYNETNSSDGSSHKAVTHVRPAVIDDFIRKFLIKVGTSKTLETFNTEWYELKAKGKLNEDYTNPVPDIYLRNQELDDSVQTMRVQLEKMKDIAAKAQGTWDKFRKERDFHRMHHKRVVIEKNRLITDLRRLQKHFDAYEPTLVEMKKKYEAAIKEKMLIRLERDRMKARVEGLNDQVRTLLDEGRASQAEGGGASASYTSSPSKAAAGSVPSSFDDFSKNRKKDIDGQRQKKFPVQDAHNPFHDLVFKPPSVQHYTLQNTFRGHLNSIAAITFHPRKPVFATVSDDQTWKLWSSTSTSDSNSNSSTCDLIMSGEGHTDWLGSVDFHPKGHQLATGSGDGTIKLWDFATAGCKATYTDHTQAVWGVAYHHTGDFLASCSMDHTIRLWDTASGVAKHVLRGHVDSVNAVTWQLFTSNLVTCSGDKTVSLWDARTCLCIQTFYGHMNAANHVVISRRGDTIASCDADGIIKLWDVRMVSELATIETGPYPVNQVAFDRSGLRLACGTDEALVKVYDPQSGQQLAELAGHEDAVQAVAFDPSDQFLLSASSDCSFRLWA